MKSIFEKKNFKKGDRVSWYRLYDDLIVKDGGKGIIVSEFETKTKDDGSIINLGYLVRKEDGTMERFFDYELDPRN